SARLTTRAFPAPDLTVAEREYFQVQRAGDSGPFASQLLRSPMTDDTSIVMSRRIESDQGDFRGAALIVIDPGYFQAFYRSIRVAYPATIDLFRSDLAVIIHYPEVTVTEALSLRKWPDRSERAALGESGTIYRARSSFDDVE